mmetsp:Transcript_8207/g.13833  ORF Transcript_8207/g.13833 Transcript_8207/m.13833 type:complete len:206 (+) Transcript_8207:1190-1807(+)
MRARASSVALRSASSLGLSALMFFALMLAEASVRAFRRAKFSFALACARSLAASRSAWRAASALSSDSTLAVAAARASISRRSVRRRAASTASSMLRSSSTTVGLGATRALRSLSMVCTKLSSSLERRFRASASALALYSANLAIAARRVESTRLELSEETEVTSGSAAVTTDEALVEYPAAWLPLLLALCFAERVCCSAMISLF